jgi:hypothetical protein
MRCRSMSLSGVMRTSKEFSVDAHEDVQQQIKTKFHIADYANGLSFATEP